MANAFLRESWILCSRMSRAIEKGSKRYIGDAAMGVFYAWLVWPILGGLAGSYGSIFQGFATLLAFYGFASIFTKMKYWSTPYIFGWFLGLGFLGKYLEDPIFFYGYCACGLIVL